MIGQILLNRYEILEKTGEGGMAVVYRARDTLLNRQVAVKILRQQFAGDQEFRERFRREAQAAASLSHPNIVNIYDVGDTGRVHFIVMEFVVGRTLSEIIRQESPLPIDLCLDIAGQMAQALAHAHQHQIVHRDIKPHNILVTQDGRVKVTDFGIAQALSTANLTQTGMVMGSVHYFSPEQAKGVHIQHYSDLYSLGIVLFEMLTGTVPFKGESPIAVALKQIQDPPPHVSQKRIDAPKEVADLVMRLLNKDPKQRVASARELAALLSQHGAGSWETKALADTASAFRDLSDGSTDQDYDGFDSEEDEMADKDAAKNKKKRTKKPAKKRRSLIPFLLLILLLIGLVWTAQHVLPRLLFPEEVQVPDLTGLTYTEAQRTLREFGLQLEGTREIYDNEAPPGTIVGQDPSPGRTVRQGRSVLIQVSRGPEYVLVPDVIGMSNREARLALTQAGFILGEEEAVMDQDAALNEVVGQSPPAGQQVPLGLAVDLRINRGREALGTLTVPDVRGMPAADARRLLESQGFTIGSSWSEFSTVVQSGRIIEQNPAPGREVEAGWSIDYVISQGQPAESPPPTAQVPSQPPVDPGASQQPQQPAPASGNEMGVAWTTVDIVIDVPEGRSQEVVILVIDDFGAREVYRDVETGGSRFTQSVQGRGDEAQIQVYIGGRMYLDSHFRDLVGT